MVKGLALLAQFSCGQLSVLLAENDLVLISFWVENKHFQGASLFTCFYDCSVIERSFARTTMSLSDFVLPVLTIGGWLKICVSCRWMICQSFVTNGKISFVVSFFHCYLSISLVILLVVVLNGDLFVQNINISNVFPSFSGFFFFFYILYFILFRVFATVVTINKADRPVNFTIFHCRTGTN